MPQGSEVREAEYDIFRIECAVSVLILLSRACGSDDTKETEEKALYNVALTIEDACKKLRGKLYGEGKEASYTAETQRAAGL